MLVIYDRKTAITFPNGKTYSPGALKATDAYSWFFEYTTVLDNDSDGVTNAYYRLAALVDMYDVTPGKTDEETLAAINAEIQRRKDEAAKEKTDVQALTDRMDALAGTTDASAAQTRSTLQLLAAKAATTMTQTELHGVGSVWPDFTPGAFYKTRQLVRFEGHYYFVLTDTCATTGEDNRPDKDTKAYKLMSDPDKDGVFPFSAPLGDSDAYGKGDKVSVNGTVYVSQIDANKSIPGHGEDGQKYWLKA